MRPYFVLANFTTASVISSPAILIDLLMTIPPKLMTAISVVPPPISMMICPSAVNTGSPAPMADAIGSSTKNASRAPAANAASCTARRSTSVTPAGIPTATLGRGIFGIHP